MRALAWVALAACGGAAARRDIATLRPACGDGQMWTGRACQPKPGDAAKQLDTATKALVDLKVDEAKAALDAAEHGGPLDHAHAVALWEDRGLAAAYVDDEAGASAAFDMLLALDPGHALDYTLSPKATFVFDKVRKQAGRVAPELDVTWTRDSKVGDPLPVDIEVVADPKKFFRRATLFVRERGETSWRAADLALSAKDQRVVLPAIDAKKNVSLELYAKAYDDHGNEVLVWADPARPREVPLRYIEPTPWYKQGWFIITASAVAIAIAGVTTYELTVSPPDKIDGTATVAK
ncbi:MAG TPA: hypothetical protein VMJ10_15285 [Kofleriaceae bacterium]|nr:hypothetical protein [Kofleriaceae bacterium]